MSRFRGFSLLAAITVVALIAAPTVVARGKDDDDGGRRHLTADPWVFVGSAAQCAPAPAGSRIVTSAWLPGMGLPDNGRPNAPDPSARRDPHLGLLLNKNGPTSDCSSSGATIRGVKGIVLDNPASFVLGYDYRFGGHCGGGAPRFNLTIRTTTGVEWTYFAGCVGSVQTPAMQDSQWIQSRSPLIAGVVFPQRPDLGQPAVIPPGSRIVALDIVYDEGTDPAGGTSVSDPNSVGLAVIDNIYVNGRYIRSGSGIEPGGGHRDHDERGGGHDDDD